MEATLIGKTTAEFMEFLENEYGEDDSAEVKEVMVVALVDTERDPDTGEIDELGFSITHFRTSEITWPHKYGLAASVMRSLEKAGPE